jgi:hypothetical protein
MVQKEHHPLVTVPYRIRKKPPLHCQRNACNADKGLPVESSSISGKAEQHEKEVAEVK